jgi:predicted metal-dependent hydrolase
MLPLRQMLFGKKAPAPPKVFAPVAINIEGRTVTIVVKPHATARRMVLRLSRDGENFALTVPRRQSQSGILPFVEASRIWMQNTLAQRGRRVEAAAVDKVMLRGAAMSIQRSGKTRGLVQFDPDARSLLVPGDDAHWQRRLVDWLKQQADDDLRRASSVYAEKMEARFARLTVRDQKSRWGSCSSDGALSYSWRLILAPPFVLDYVAAHEVAHLREMNHGPRFWRLVLTHCAHTRAAKQWLKTHGHTLHHGLG